MEGSMMDLHIEVDDRGMRRKLKEWQRRVKRAGGATCTILPTEVIRMLSDKTGRKLLRVMPAPEARELEKQGGAKVAKALMLPPRVRPERVAKAFRYWAYRYVELLWRAVAHRGVWGAVRRKTYERKQRDPSGDGQATSRGLDPFTYGVRHKAPAWYALQKHQLVIGKRDQRAHLLEGDPLIEVRIDHKVISRR